jgi:hypothetical protein
MSKRALIHVGTGKTGTTSIQESLSSQKPKLAGIGYPNVAGNAHHFLDVVYNERAKLSRGYRTAYKDEAARLKDAETFRSRYLKRLTNNRAVIISSEFLNKFEESKIEALKEDLEACGYTKFRILCYVRNPISYYRSALQQSLKASHAPPHPGQFRYGVRTTIERYRRCFGDENVVARAFDSGLYEGDVVQDFVKQVENFFGVEISGLKTKGQNYSISAEALFILQRYRELYDFDSENMLTPKSELLREYLERLPASEITPIQLNPGVEALIYRRFEDEVNWIRENCNIELEMDSSAVDLGLEYKKRNYHLLENIIKKPSDASLDQIKFDMINSFLAMYESENAKSSRLPFFRKYTKN